VINFEERADMGTGVSPNHNDDHPHPQF
jgi:hypothetical protein